MIRRQGLLWRGWLVEILKLPLNAGGCDRLRGWSWGRKELLAVSRAVPLESSLVDRRLRLKKRKQKKNETCHLTFYFFYFYLLISRRVVTWEQHVTCWHHLKYINVFEKRAGSECAETRSRSALANGTYCCAFVLTMLSPSEFGFSPSLSVVDPWILGFICE